MRTEQKRTWLTGAHLKWIAIVTMAIDHGAAVLLEPILLNTTVTSGNYELLQIVNRIYMILRCIGRFAFPVFCFLLVEGFWHTRSKAKYLRNLMIFALVSEVPFDLALYGKVCSWQHQNVFFTLAAGFGAIWIAEHFTLKAMRDSLNVMLYRALSAAGVVGIALLAEFIHTDYGAAGVATIFLLYAMRGRPVVSALAAWLILGLTNFLEFYCFPFVGAVHFYNGERGRQNKYFFYVFYPVHLLILAILKVIIFK